MLYSHYVYILFFTLQFEPCISSIWPFKENPSKISSYEHLNLLNKAESECYHDCSCLQCNTTLINPGRVINPYKADLNNRVPPKAFGTFCIKCVACIAVASEMQYLIDEVKQECEYDDAKKKYMLQTVNTTLENLCKFGFKKFLLRKYGKHSVFTDNYDCTSHVNTPMDGSWTGKLREICSFYLMRIQVEDIIFDSKNIVDTLCRGSGVFRDCVNIHSQQNIVMPCRDCDGC